MALDKNRQIATDVLAAVGGKDNVATALHCMTRLRLNLKDDGLADIDQIKKLPGVLTAMWSGGQLQVVIGQNVPKVHAAMISEGVKSGGTIDENLDGDTEKRPLTPKAVGEAILGYLSGSMVPMIPVLMCAGLFKTLAVILAPGMLGVVPEDSDVITLLNFLYNAGFYFMPVYLGYNAANQLGVTPVLGAFMGGILIAPEFMEIAKAGTPFSVFGIPCAAGAYNSTVIPILLSVWVMSYVERIFRRFIPDMLATIFVPFLTMTVMVPISLCGLAPLGGFLGDGLGTLLFSFGSQGGVVAIIGGGIVAGLWVPMVAAGMHVTIIMLAQTAFVSTGCDSFFMVVTTLALWAAYGIELGSFLRLKNHEEKSLAFGYFFTNIVGGVGEPFIYGMLFKHPRLWVVNIVSAFAGGALAIALHVVQYNISVSSALNLLAFMGPSGDNFVKAVICAAVAFATGVVVTYLFGFTAEEIEGTEPKAIEEEAENAHDHETITGVMSHAH